MNIIVCGAGHVGSHAAELLATSGHDVVVVDRNETRLRRIEEALDLQTLHGQAATAETLKLAGADKADLVVAATSLDETNLFCASISKGLGAGATIARVHHSTYFAQRDLDYKAHFGIDHLICPEFTTARAIAQTIRNPAAIAIESLAKGQIEMQEFPVSHGAAADGQQLSQLRLPEGSRLATVQKEGKVFIPQADTVVEEGDVVILVGNHDIFDDARKLFHTEKAGRRNIVLFGGTSTAVHLARVMRDRRFSIRIFEENLDRARELADKLDWTTILNADPTDRVVFDEEHLDRADAFVALLDDDDRNILSCAWAKTSGVPMAVAVVQNPDYLPLLPSVGIDRPFSTRTEAGKEIAQIVDTRPLRCLASLSEGVVDVYSIQVGARSMVLDRPLRELRLDSQWMLAAIQRDHSVRVPTANDQIQKGDTLLVIGRHDDDRALKRVFDAR